MEIFAIFFLIENFIFHFSIFRLEKTLSQSKFLDEDDEEISDEEQMPETEEELRKLIYTLPFFLQFNCK